MKPPAIQYVRPATVDEALRFLGDDALYAKVLAGGQSLVPMMNFRLARPELLVDLAALPGMTGIACDAETIRIGAMTRQHEVEHSDAVHALTPLLRDALRHVGHEQTRSRGTVGGSLVHADPAAELPAIALALEGELEARGPRGARTIRAEDFFTGPYTSALEDDEILLSVTLRVPRGLRTAFTEFTRRHGDFALAGIAAAVRPAAGSDEIADARIAAFGVGSTPVRLRAAEDAVRGAPLQAASIEAAAAAAAEEVDPLESHGVSADYRRRLTGTLVGRVLKELS